MNYMKIVLQNLNVQKYTLQLLRAGRTYAYLTRIREEKIFKNVVSCHRTFSCGVTYVNLSNALGAGTSRTRRRMNDGDAMLKKKDLTFPHISPRIKRMRTAADQTFNMEKNPLHLNVFSVICNYGKWKERTSVLFVI